MRVEWDLDGFNIDCSQGTQLFAAEFAEIAKRHHMHWQLKLTHKRPRLALMVSQYDHCLVDLLYRHQSGELACDIPLIISNHRKTEKLAGFYGIPFHLIEVTKD
jgi:formyltetrahydrofolate deformylase